MPRDSCARFEGKLALNAAVDEAGAIALDDRPELPALDG